MSMLLFSSMLFSYFLLLHIYWLPSHLQALVVVLMGIALAAFLVYCFSLPKKHVGISEEGAFLLVDGERFFLEFVRANGFQLIAKVGKQKALKLPFIDRYQVIYFDNLGRSEYALFRSFAAQQMLLNRSKGSI